ncbi:hypothetical protein ED733_002903 [Metarhizium rileyi]|uniref:methylenetetrahydrofolate dehydrogenase (NADP(+)) n=1 Tax=Metarhizium rileyi (strain RCEF 4871) TaxID=1649241 RepID=A0A5C6G3V8_METRR|nr:hypothetical protein ED733_002903 [Metarhizium rileyi]
MGATLLEGHPVVEDIERWCLRKRRGELEAVLAVLFFNTDAAAEHYVRIKAHVAARVSDGMDGWEREAQQPRFADEMSQAGVGYWVYEMSPEASTAEVVAQIEELNRDARVHGVLVQRPLPRHLDELKTMASVSPAKQIEEYCEGRASNVAADALGRLLSKHGRHRRALCRSAIHIVGFGNVITNGFVSHMRRCYPRVSYSPGLPEAGGAAQRDASQEVLITELHRGPRYVKPRMIRPEVGVVVDLGFYASEKGFIVGDLDRAVLERDGLAVAPTPGGMLPILLWVMMERTIRAAERLSSRTRGQLGCLCQ